METPTYKELIEFHNVSRIEMLVEIGGERDFPWSIITAYNDFGDPIDVYANNELSRQMHHHLMGAFVQNLTMRGFDEHGGSNAASGVVDFMVEKSPFVISKAKV